MLLPPFKPPRPRQVVGMTRSLNKRGGQKRVGAGQKSILRERPPADVQELVTVSSPPYGWVAEPYLETGVFQGFADAVRSLGNSHLIYQLRHANSLDATFLFIKARELDIVLKEGVDATLAGMEDLFNLGSFNGRFPTSILLVRRGTDLQRILKKEAVSFVRAEEAKSLRQLLDVKVTGTDEASRSFRRVMLWDRAATEMGRLLISTVCQSDNRSPPSEIAPTTRDFSPTDGGADLLHRFDRGTEPPPLLVSQVKGSSKGNPLCRLDMERELKKHFAPPHEPATTRARKRRMKIFPELNGEVLDPFCPDNTAERLGLAFSRSISPGLDRPFWSKGQRLSALASSAAYMPWFSIEVALLEPDW